MLNSCFVSQNTADLRLTWWQPKALKSSGFCHIFYPIRHPERLPEHEYEGHFFRGYPKKQGFNQEYGKLVVERLA